MGSGPIRAKFGNSPFRRHRDPRRIHGAGAGAGEDMKQIQSPDPVLNSHRQKGDCEIQY